MIDHTISPRAGRAALAGLLATAALGTATAGQAQAQPVTATPTAEQCEQRLQDLEARFRVIEAKRGWEAAAEWWQKRWAAYHDACIAGR
jgi:hypothetical protein